MEIKSDYTAEGLDRLLSTLKSEGETRTKLEHLIASYLDEAQVLEDAAFPLIDELSISGATGDRLNRLGELANVPRDGRGDDDYRQRIRAEIAILTSQGRPSDIFKVFWLLIGADPNTDTEYDEAYPKSLVIRQRNRAINENSTPPISPVEFEAKVSSLLQRAAPAGTQVHVVYSGYRSSDENVFRFSDTADTTEASVSHGLENGWFCEGT